MEFFTKIAPILIIIGLILVFIVLVIGLISMLMKSEFNKKYSNKLMRLRVIAQGLIILIFAFPLSFSFAPIILYSEWLKYFDINPLKSQPKIIATIKIK